MGELSKLLLGAQPAKALRLARDTGVLVAAPAGVRAGDRVRAGEPLPRPDRRRAHVRGRAGGSRRGRSAARAARGALPRPRQAARRLARDRRPAALLREARLLGDAATSRSAPSSPTQALRRLRYPTELRKRVVRIVRAPHVRPGQGRPLRARTVARALRRRARLRPARPQGGRPARARAQPPRRRRARAARRASGRSSSTSSWEPAPAPRSRGRRQRSDRARLPARARRSGRRCRPCSTTSSTTRR